MSGISESESFARQTMQAIDAQISHIWMVRTFLKHSDEATDDDELADVHRGLYDFMLALGPALDEGNGEKYLKLARKKLGRLRSAAQTFYEIQPEVSGHMNYRMAAQSLRLAVDRIVELMAVRSQENTLVSSDLEDDSGEIEK